MKSQLKIICCSVFVFLHAIVNAQEAFTGRNLGDHILIKMMDESIIGESEVKVDGSPYLNDEYVDGRVYSQGIVFTDMPMRYNVHQDYIEFRQNGKDYILDPDKRIQKVEIGEQTFVVAKTDVIGKMKDSYFLQLDSGKVQLLLKKVVVFKEAQPPKALESSATPAKYQLLPDQFYYRFGSGEVEKITSVKKMIAGFPDKQEELTLFARKEKISSRKQEELMRLVQYYNSL